MNTKNKYIIVTGFALFAMFFGAGNLIFPPYLGVITGDKFLIGVIGFILADAGLSLLAILAAAKTDGDTKKAFGRAGKNFAVILGSAIMICLGPLLAIPRTAATTFEMGANPLIPGLNPVLFSTIFFALVLVLTIKPSKVVDIIGSYLTPALLVCLLVIIAVGIIKPIGSISEASIQNVFNEGILQGYQTLDALGAICLSTVLIKNLVQKGYKKEQDRVSILLKAGVIATVGLAIVYGGLTYLGATVSSVYDATVTQSTLIVAITISLLGTPGKIILSVIVTLACLTTAIGLTSATAEYFSKLTKNKLKYEHIVIIVCLLSLVISTLGVGTIIKFSGPILEIVYPVLMVLVIMTLVSENIKNDNAFKGAALATFVVSLLSVANSLWQVAPFTTKLPLATFGFNWIIPAIVGALIGSCIKASARSSMYEIE